MEPRIQPLRTEVAAADSARLGASSALDAIRGHRVLRNTYALLSLTLLFSAGVAALSVAWRLPAPGILLTLAGFFGLLFAVYKLKNSVWALPAVFALTGFMGYTLGPLLTRVISLPGERRP